MEDGYRAHLLDLLNLPSPPELEAEYAALGATERAAQRAALLARVVKRLAEQTPRLLVIEDVHWAPPAVRAYVVAIARVLHECPALMLLTTRPEFESGVGQWDTMLDGLPNTCHGVGLLTDTEAQELALSFTLNDPQIVAQCIERSGRNPLFLEQLLRSRVVNASAALPTSIQTLVAAQVDRLGELDKRAVQAAAVLGKQFDLAALRAIIERPDYDCAPLTEHRLVHAEGQRMAFFHALVQEGVLSSLLRRDRQRLHRLAAEWFLGRDASLRARHLDFAEDEGAPFAYLQAARSEVASHRFVFALDLLLRGLQLVKERALEFQLRSLEGEVLSALGRTGESANAYRSAATLADDANDKCRALLGAAEALRTTGGYEEGLALLDEAQALTAADRTLALAQIHYMRGNIYFLQMDALRCEVEQKKAFAFAQACRAPEMEALALVGLARMCFVGGRMNGAMAHVRRYLQVCDEHALEHVRYAQINMLGIALHYQLEVEEAVIAFHASRDHAPRVGAPRQAVIGAALGADALLDFGRLDEAAEFARASIELSQRVGESRYEPIGTALLVRAEAGEHDPTLAEHELRAIWERLSSEERAFSGWWVLGGVMRCARSAQARQWATQQARHFTLARSFGAGCLRFFHDAITASLLADERDAAIEFATRLESYVGQEVSPLTRMHLRWAHASAHDDVDEMRALRAEASRTGLGAIAKNITV